MKRGSMIAGILLLILAAAVWIGSGSFASESAFFPRAVAVAIVVLTTLMLIENQSVQDSVAFDWQQFNYYRTAKIFILTCIYLALLPYIGFLIATTLCLIIMMCVLEKGDLKLKIFSSVLTTACIYFVFQVMLDVPLPAWSF